MPHAFSVQIHDYLTGKLGEAQEKLSRALSEHDKLAARFQEGAIAELLAVRQVLSERYDLKTRKYF